MTRNRRAEADWLLDLAQRARRMGWTHSSSAGFHNGVIARLDQYGDHVTPRPIHGFIREIEEEALDLAGWALLTLEAHPTIDRNTRDILQRVAACGYAAHALLSEVEVEGR